MSTIQRIILGVAGLATIYIGYRWYQWRKADDAKLTPSGYANETGSAALTEGYEAMPSGTENAALAPTTAVDAATDYMSTAQPASGAPSQQIGLATTSIGGGSPVELMDENPRTDPVNVSGIAVVDAAARDGAAVASMASAFPL